MRKGGEIIFEYNLFLTRNRKSWLKFTIESKGEIIFDPKRGISTYTIFDSESCQKLFFTKNEIFDLELFFDQNDNPDLRLFSTQN